jgi:amino acid transporter
MAGVLAGGRLGIAAMLGAVMAAAAPLTVVAGVVSTAYAVTGVVGLPAAFAVVGLVLAVFAIGYVAMSRHLPHAGAFYSYCSHGLGRPAGVSTAWVSLVAYNALQTGLFGLVGAATTPLIQQWAGLEVPWWVPALGAWVLVGTLGMLRVDLNGRVLGVLLIAEITIIGVYDVAWLTHPAHGLDWSLWSPARLTGPGVGAVLAIAVLGYVGFETATVYAEEARHPRRTVPATTYLALGIIAVLYGVSSWAMAAATGTTQIADAARAQGPDLVFGLAAAHLGPGAATLGRVLLSTSVLAAMISFHGTSARYMYALGREQVLPRVFGQTSRRGAPKASSIAQSLLALTVITTWAVGGWDPVVTLFYITGTSGALGVLTLLLLVAFAVVGFFARKPRGESAWQTLLAPLTAIALLGLILALVIANFAALLGVPDTSPLRWGIPAGYLAVAVAGCGYGLVLKRARPHVYAAIGRGALAALPPPAPPQPVGTLFPNGPLTPTADPGWPATPWITPPITPTEEPGR